MDLHLIAVNHLITTATLRDLGFDINAVRRLLKEGTLRRIIRGWYAVRSPDEALAPWEHPDPFTRRIRRHLLLLHALNGNFQGRACASHGSSMVAHEISVWQSDLTTASLCRLSDDHSRHRRGARLHPACGVEPVTTSTGLLTVPPAIGIVQAGLSTLADGTGVPMESLICADNALYRQLITPDDLAAAVAHFEGVPGIAAVRTLLRHADGRHETVGETRMMSALRLLGYDIVPQWTVRLRGRSYRVDGRVRGTKACVEFDGMSKYTDGEGEGDAGFRALRAEKTRQDDLSSDGYAFARFGWHDLDHPAVLKARVDAAIRRADPMVETYDESA